MRRRIASHYALIGGKLERNIIVEVDGNGLITNIWRTTALDATASVEFHPGILIPGMVNAHCHLELSYLKGAIEEGLGYGGFARAIGAVRGGFTDDRRIRAAEVADAQMWQEGVEVVADIANDELVMGVKAKSKIEYHTLFEFFGLNNRDTEAHFAMASRHTRSTVTPHSTYSVQDAPFLNICQRNGGLLSLHFLESENEAALFNHSGALAEWYARMGWECDFLHYGSPARRVAEALSEGATHDRRVLLVHNTMATAEDVQRVEGAVANASWVLCPESNRYISRLTPPIAMLRTMGARIAIGSDSLASARTLSLLDNLKLIDDVPLNELLTYATLNGAIALGVEDRKGSLDVGKAPGLVVIEGADLHNLRLTPESTSHRIV